MQFLEEKILEKTETTWQSMLIEDIHFHALPTLMVLAEGHFTGEVEIS